MAQEELSVESFPKPPEQIHYDVGGIRISPAAVLAPMEGVTNLVFRRLIRELGGPGLTFTEFFPSKSIAESGGKVLDEIAFDPEEYPIAIQIFGREPDVMAEAARVVQDMGATIVDINMGCPSKKVCARSGGSALMREPELAVEIVRAVRKVVTVPLTVKMRTGFDHSNKNAPELAYRFQEEGVDALTIHWRTKVDLYSGERDVTPIAEAVRRVRIPVLGNGDVVDIASADAMLRETGCAGVMVGRGAVQDPWLLLKIARWMRGEAQPVINARERERVLLMYHQKIHEAFGTDRAALNRLKMVTKHFAEPLVFGKTFRKRVVQSQETTEALDHIRRYFDLLAQFESGELDAFHGSTFDEAA